MSLSVERLKQIEAGFSDDGELFVSDAVGDCPGVMADVRCALRELRAIKEAKPVAYAMPNSAITGAPHALMLVSLDVPSNDQYGGALWVPLIRKPE